MLLLVNINVFYIKITILIQFKFKSNLILKLTKSKNLASGVFKMVFKKPLLCGKSHTKLQPIVATKHPPHYKKHYAIYNIKFFYLNILN